MLPTREPKTIKSKLKRNLVIAGVGAFVTVLSIYGSAIPQGRKRCPICGAGRREPHIESKHKKHDSASAQSES